MGEYNQPSRIYDSQSDTRDLRACLFCWFAILNGQLVVDLVGLALGSLAHEKCNRDVYESGAYV